jgi:hypothetical protein
LAPIRDCFGSIPGGWSNLSPAVVTIARKRPLDAAKMLATAADNQNQGTAIRIALSKNGTESTGLLGTTEEAAGFDMRGEPFGHQRLR